MKKNLFLAFFMVMILVLTGCATTRYSTMGVECYSDNPFHPCVVPPASEDHTHGIAGAIAESMNPGDGNSSDNKSSSDQDAVSTIKAYQFQNGAVVNTTGYDMMLEFVIAYFPGNIDAKQLMARTGVYNMPGYEMLSVRVAKRTTVKITLKPGIYDVNCYRLGSSGAKLVRTDTLRVDVRPGRHKEGNETYDFIYYY